MKSAPKFLFLKDNLSISDVSFSYSALLQCFHAILDKTQVLRDPT